MEHITIVEFLDDVLGMKMHVLSDKGWYRCCCPVHDEKRPSFGVFIHYPYIAKCFGCNYKATLPMLTAKVLGISEQKALDLINSKIDIKLEMRERGPKKVRFVPDAVVQMYEMRYPKSLAAKYAKFRGIPQWAAKLWNFGYDDLNNALVVPLRDVKTGDIQSYFSVQFKGADFTEVFKYKPEEAGGGVTVPSNYKAFDSCVVVEGYVDAIKAAMLLWNNDIEAVPVALNTAFPTKAQMDFIRKFKRVYLGLDHDDSGRRGRDHCRKQLRDKAFVYDFVYGDDKKDPGELTESDKVSTKLII